MKLPVRLSGSGWAVILMALIPAACRTPEAAPWTLLELGTTPVVDALDQHLLVAAFPDHVEHTWPGILIPGDTATPSRIAYRDLLTLPEIACGDLMRLRPEDLPMSLAHALVWPEGDSLTLRWTCMDRREFSAFAERFILNTDHPDLAESLWLSTLRRWFPESASFPESRYARGQAVHLDILAVRPDGSAIGDTVHLDFHLGDADQVVPALQPGLDRAGPGAHWSVWARSEDAFGSAPHPDLRLPAHAPVLFRVQAR